MFGRINQINRFVIVVIVIVFKMVDNGLKTFYAFVKICNVVTFWEIEFSYISAAQAKIPPRKLDRLV